MSYNVLIVDDSAAMRRMIRRALSQCGADIGGIREASDGAQALQILASGRWADLVLTDINMPSMSGSTMLEHMRDSDELCDIATVVVTSDRSQALIQRARGLGVKGYLLKPFRPDDLRAMVDKALDSVG